MMRLRKTVLAPAAAALMLWSPAAHGQTAVQCANVLIDNGIPAASHTPDPCADLSIMVAAKAPSVMNLADVFLGSTITPRDLQSQHPQQAALGGTPAQGHAVPGVQPAGVAAGTIAAVGTEAGDAAIAALGVNPAILFLDDAVSERLAQFSRFADLTVFVPVSDPSSDTDPDDDDDNGLEYFGARLRINFTGISSGSTVWNEARKLTGNWIGRQADNSDHVRKVLGQAPDLSGCVTALLNPKPAEGEITQKCGAPVTLQVNQAEAEALRDELAKVRRAADARYFGMDIRYDHGDPTMGAVENASGSFLFAGLAYGRRLGSDADRSANLGFRSRLGVRHASLDGSDESEFAVEGGLGFEMARQLERQEINAAIGLEFRQGNAEEAVEDELQTNYGMIRGSFLVPITSGNSLSINVGTPVWGDVSPVLSVNFNWGLLLPGRPSR